MSSLSNYLHTNRKRLALSQEEVGFLIGINGEGKGIKVSRDENDARVPDLRTALAYEALYGKPIRELFGTACMSRRRRPWQNAPESCAIAKQRSSNPSFKKSLTILFLK